MDEIRVVFCTCPDTGVAASLARLLVKHRLAACVNILPEIRSIYRWQGEVQDDAECLMMIKTTQAAVKEVQRWLIEQHPYDEPEVIAVPVSEGSPGYLAWVAAETQTGK